MARLEFKTLRFELKNELLEVYLLNIFKAEIPLDELEKIAHFKIINKHILEFKIDQNKAENKFSLLLTKYFNDLVNILNNNKSYYIHQNSGIPLIGNVSFGIVYRNTSLIEIKPITSCNLNCIYCSVGEGKNSKKVDYVIEKDYLILELKNLLRFVKEPVEVHIGVQGEPFLYADLVELIEDLCANKQINVVSLDSNFTLVTKAILNRLSKCKKLRFNVSLDALNPEIAVKMAGCEYNVNYVQEMIKYAVQKGIRVLIAPLFLPGYNNQELEKIVNFVKELGQEELEKHPQIGIQNFLNYKTGRNPVKAWNWQKFYSLLTNLEQKTSVKLLRSFDEFGIHKTKELPKPFEIGDKVNAILVIPDRFKNSSIAMAKGRLISIPDCPFKEGKKVKIKITRDKHNIFGGKLI